MHRLNSIALAFASTLAIGCADNARSETSDPGEVTGSLDEHAYPGGGGGVPSLEVGYDLTQPSCEAPLLAFEVFDVLRADGTRVANPECVIAFDDGTISNACTGEHIFAEGGVHSLRVTVIDRETNEVFTETTSRNITPPIGASLAAQQVGCELAIEVAASHDVTAFSIVSVSPEENVVGEPASPGAGTHHFRVTQPGIYEVAYFVEDERAIPICTERLVERVEVKDCHPTPPPCDVVDHAH